ncbi:unnamed protein product [Rhodiola kirilowii]
MARSDMENEGKGGAWFLHSGCSNHMTGNKEWFIKIDESFKHTVKLGNNTRMPVKGKKTSKVHCRRDHTDVYYVPELSTNLLSMGQLQEKGLTILIKEVVCRVYHSERGLIMNTKMTGE